MKQRAFTLIEVLIALFIFAIIAGITGGIIYQMFSTRNHTKLIADRVESLQLTYILLNRDFRQAVPKPIFFNNTIELRAFLGLENQVSFTRGGYINPLQTENRSELQRISIQLQNGQLIRKRWDKIDHASNDAAATQVLLNDVETMQLTYVGKAKQGFSNWPAIHSDNFEPTPMRVEMVLTLKNWGAIRWVFPCHDA